MTTCPVDHPRLWVAAVAAFVIAAGAVTGLYLFTNADVHARHVLMEPTGALSLADTVDVEDADLVFHEDDIRFKNEVSSGSTGLSFFAHERLFCLSLSGDEVVDVRLADTIQESDYHAISGGCKDVGLTPGMEMGLAHTHPNYNSALSDTDKEVQNPPFEITCIIYDEIIEVRGDVHGLRCWQVPDEPGGPDREFPELELAIVSDE